MPWQLLLSVVPVICLLGALMRYELRASKMQRAQKKEEQALIVPLAKKIQEKHVIKYGRADTDIEREFPELHQAK
jgi:hypothetical protein